MKHLFLMSCILTFFVLNASCELGRSETLIGKWKLSKEYVAEKTMWRDPRPDLAIEIEFLKDGALVMKLPDGKIFNGKYTSDVKVEPHRLVTAYDNSTTYFVYKIQEEKLTVKSFTLDNSAFPQDIGIEPAGTSYELLEFIRVN